MLKKLFILTLITIPTLTFALKPMTDAEVKKMIVDGEVSSFSAPCPCPYSKDQKGQECGDNSQYMKNRNTVSVRCFVEDVNDQQVYNYRAQHNVPDPDHPYQIFPQPK